MRIFREFREFAMRGNVMDLAVGVIIGGAFGKIVSSLVGDILMPLLSVLTGGINLTEKKLALGHAAVNYGVFIQNIIDFLIIAFVIFLMIKAMNKLRRRQEEKKEAPLTGEERLLTEIRDILRNQK